MARRPKPGWIRFEFHTGPGHQSEEIWYEWCESYDLEEAKDDTQDWLNNKLRMKRGYDTDQWTGSYKRVKYIPTEALVEMIGECQRSIKYHRVMSRAYRERLPVLKKMMAGRKVSVRALKERKLRKRWRKINEARKKNGAPPISWENYR